MVASGFLPVAIHKNKLFFLFGKESDGDSSPGFSDFAGGVEKGEKNLYQAGLREMAEETTGFFGNPQQIDDMVQKNGGVYKMKHGAPRGAYHIHIFRMDYDDRLIDYYNKSHQFIYDRLDHAYLKSTMIFEKAEIQWMTVEDMIARRSEFRHFYQEILDHIVKDLPQIDAFVRSRRRSPRRTTLRRNSSGATTALRSSAKELS